MATTPEILKAEPGIQERREEFMIPETLQQLGVRTVQKNFNAQVKDDSGQSLISTPPAQVITIIPPYSQEVLASKAKGSTNLSLTWLAAFWLRIIKKAIYFGWRIIGKSQN